MCHVVQNHYLNYNMVPRLINRVEQQSSFIWKSLKFLIVLYIKWCFDNDLEEIPEMLSMCLPQVKKKKEKKAVRAVGTSKDNVHRILKHRRWKSYIPTVVHDLKKMIVTEEFNHVKRCLWTNSFQTRLYRVIRIHFSETTQLIAPIATAVQWRTQGFQSGMDCRRCILLDILF